MLLPVDAALPELTAALRNAGHAVLQAPPGAGKTTRVPLALLNEPWLEGRIIMLEPRRLAARAAARYMARQLGENVGETVGYRVHMDTRVSARTRIEVVTEGVLTRMLQSDAGLEGISLVIFDEFHERSLHADLGLALTLQSRELLRAELRILVMSATLEGERVAALLGNAPLITSQGRTFPVETRYLKRDPEGRIEDAVTTMLIHTLKVDQGDVLVFLPGAPEIRRVQDQLALALVEAPQQLHSTQIDVYPLYGDLPAEQQDRAIAPSPPNRRKVVLATAIAETSLTIEGVRAVIDSGLMRVPRFSPRTGMTRLETIAVTRASADQRRGRAGRTAAGVCYRLWTEARHSALLQHGQPEIMQADLAPLALELAAWGAATPTELRWLDPPPAAAFAQARELLVELAAIDAAGTLTRHGRRLVQLPLHPRVAHMLVRAAELGHAETGAELAALIEERDVLKGEPDPDLELRLKALRDGHRLADRNALQRVRTEARELARMVEAGPETPEPIASDTQLVAFAYPDRIGQKRNGPRGRFLMRNGRGVSIEPASSLADAELIVIAQVDDRGSEARAFLAAALDAAEIERWFADQFEHERVITWISETRSVRAVERLKLGAIVWTERPGEPTAEEVADTVIAALRREGLGTLRWSVDAELMRQRLAFLHQVDPLWPDPSDEALLESLDDWLRPHLTGNGNDPLRRIDAARTLDSLIGWQRRAQLDELAPTHMTVPSGSRLPIDYSDPAAPSLAVRLQEVFGWTETPRLAFGRVPLTLQLLSPAHRPVQVTRNLASFWRTGYFDVKKDLKGRYPKHYWPDDPLNATPTRRVRPPPADG